MHRRNNLIQNAAIRRNITYREQIEDLIKNSRRRRENINMSDPLDGIENKEGNENE